MEPNVEDLIWFSASLLFVLLNLWNMHNQLFEKDEDAELFEIFDSEFYEFLVSSALITFSIFLLSVEDKLKEMVPLSFA